MNLYEETMDVMTRHGKTEHDVFFCECYQIGRNGNMLTMATICCTIIMVSAYGFGYCYDAKKCECLHYAE